MNSKGKALTSVHSITLRDIYKECRTPVEKHHHEYGHYGKRHHIKAACKGVAHQICHEQEAYHKGHYEHHGAVVGKRAVAKNKSENSTEPRI